MAEQNISFSPVMLKATGPSFENLPTKENPPAPQGGGGSVWTPQDYTTVSQVGSKVAVGNISSVSIVDNKAFAWVNGGLYSYDINQNSVDFFKAFSAGGTFSGNMTYLRSKAYGNELALSNGNDGYERVRFVNFSEDLSVATVYNYSANLVNYYSFNVGVDISDKYYARGFNPANSSSGSVYIQDKNLNSVRTISCPPGGSVTFANGATGIIGPRAFGSTCALYGDTIFIGAYTSSSTPPGGTSYMGLVFAYDIITGNQLGIIYSPTSISDVRFGKDIFISGDNLVISTGKTGRTYVYDANTMVLKKSITPNTTAYDSAQMSAYGNYCVISFPYHTGGGIAYVYNINTGALLASLTPDTTTENFGWSNYIFEDKITVASANGIYVYRLS